MIGERARAFCLRSSISLRVVTWKEGPDCVNPVVVREGYFVFEYDEKCTVKHECPQLRWFVREERGKGPDPTGSTRAAHKAVVFHLW